MKKEKVYKVGKWQTFTEEQRDKFKSLSKKYFIATIVILAITIIAFCAINFERSTLLLSMSRFTDIIKGVVNYSWFVLGIGMLTSIFMFVETLYFRKISRDWIFYKNHKSKLYLSECEYIQSVHSFNDKKNGWGVKHLSYNLDCYKSSLSNVKILYLIAGLAAGLVTTIVSFSFGIAMTSIIKKIITKDNLFKLMPFILIGIVIVSFIKWYIKANENTVKVIIEEKNKYID